MHKMLAIAQVSQLDRRQDFCCHSSKSGFSHVGTKKLEGELPKLLQMVANVRGARYNFAKLAAHMISKHFNTVETEAFESLRNMKSTMLLPFSALLVAW